MSARISSNKHRVYRDRDCIVALEAFLESAVRNLGGPLRDMK
jgi:hypothetical protein